MDWKYLLAYITGTVDQELLLRNEYLVTENRILRNQLHGRVRLSDGERKVLAVIGQQLVVYGYVTDNSGMGKCSKMGLFHPKEPKPFTGLIHKPLREACEQGANARPTAPGSPPSFIHFT